MNNNSIFSKDKVTRLDGQCNECGTSELLQSETDVMKFYLEHQGHTVSILPLKIKPELKLERLLRLHTTCIVSEKNCDEFKKVKKEVLKMMGGKS